MNGQAGQIRAKSGRKASASGVDFRALLSDYAAQRWHAVVDSLSNGRPLPARDQSSLAPLVAALGPQSEEIVGIVDRFATGAAAEAIGSAIAQASPGAAFRSQLDRILAGFPQLEAGYVEEADTSIALSEGGRPKVFQSDLWQMLHKVRESAELSYAREIDLVELDRRIIFLLRGRGPLVPAGLSAAIGVDKAQVSRSVKRLLELKMVQRDQIRSPVTLSRKGELLADKLLRLAELRNRELSFDVNDRELSEFFGVMQVLLDRAVQLYEMEREIASKADQAEGEDLFGQGFEPGRPGEPVVIDRSRIVSPLLTLSAYFSRSGALSFKRKTGLSNFEAWVLSEISYNPPTDWSRLVNALERDHSQAGRTVNQLIKKGLVVRDGKPGRRHGHFSPSPEGQRLFDIILGTSRKRSDFLMEPLSKQRLEAFLATFDKIRRNASAQLERERAFEELESA
jgi:DNA-binding MarR family transcriptional regulator